MIKLICNIRIQIVANEYRDIASFDVLKSQRKIITFGCSISYWVNHIHHLTKTKCNNQSHAKYATYTFFPNHMMLDQLKPKYSRILGIGRFVDNFTLEIFLEMFHVLLNGE